MLESKDTLKGTETMRIGMQGTQILRSPPSSLQRVERDHMKRSKLNLLRSAYYERRGDELGSGDTRSNYEQSSSTFLSQNLLTEIKEIRH
jgi:hypothetical protein